MPSRLLDTSQHLSVDADCIEVRKSDAQRRKIGDVVRIESRSSGVKNRFAHSDPSCRCPKAILQRLPLDLGHALAVNYLAPTREIASPRVHLSCAPRQYLVDRSKKLPVIGNAFHPAEEPINWHGHQTGEDSQRDWRVRSNEPVRGVRTQDPLANPIVRLRFTHCHAFDARGAELAEQYLPPDSERRRPRTRARRAELSFMVSRKWTTEIGARTRPVAARSPMKSSAGCCS